MLNLSHRTMLGFQIHGNLLPFVPCLLSPPPLPRPPPPRIPGWMLLVCSDSQRPQGDGVSFPVRAVGLHWGSDLNDWASKARNQARRGEAHRNREDLHTPPPPPQKGATEELPSPISFARRQLSLSLTRWSETPLGRTTQLLIPEAWFALNSLTGPLRP